jgi:acetyltransferase-like isoleucine patch superfamily enzyme
MMQWFTGIVRVILRTIWPPLYLVWLRLRVAVWHDRAFEHAVAHCPPWLTLAILKAYSIPIGPGIDFHGRLQLHGAFDTKGKLKIGANCHIGPGVTLDLSRPIIIEDRSTIALNAQIITHQDTGYSPLAERAYPTAWGGVTIETGAYIGAGAIILQGVRIGRCAVVGAGAVVREDVPPYTVVAGVPARVIKRLDPDEMHLHNT